MYFVKQLNIRLKLYDWEGASASSFYFANTYFTLWDEGRRVRAVRTPDGALHENKAQGGIPPEAFIVGPLHAAAMQRSVLAPQHRQLRGFVIELSGKKKKERKA